MADLGTSLLWETDGYLPSAFYFTVVLPASLSSVDTSFQEVTGIGSEIQTEEVVEGGENRYVHQLPKSISHPKLVLKRGIAKVDSPFIKWCISALEGDFASPIEPLLINVQLLNGEQAPIRAWSFANAYPVNWEVDSFNSTKNEVAIETIQLAYTYSNRLV